MEQNRNVIFIVIAAIVAAIAVGLLIRGQTPAETPETKELPAASATATSSTTSASPSRQPHTAPSGRTPPAAPEQVSSYQTTSDGLQYADITPGTGESPQPGSVVTVEYTGWLKSTGKMFDSSYKRNDPFTFVIGQGEVIPGWDEGVMTMKVGGKRQLVIPAELGYGQRGAGEDIPPGATLVFDVELKKVAPPRVAPKAPEKIADKDYTTTADGLKYKDLAVGTGASPKLGDTVVVEYTGWLTNGKMFDSSYKHEGPVSFQLGRVIKGWNEGLETMKVGGKRQLVIPPDLAYGDRAIPPGAKPGEELIPPKSTLVFEVELVDVKPQ